MADPQNSREWQEAVTLAHGALALELARRFGLLSGGAEVDARRCIEVLEAGQALGYEADEALGIRSIIAEGDFDEADAERIHKAAEIASRMVGGKVAAGMRVIGWSHG